MALRVATNILNVAPLTGSVATFFLLILSAILTEKERYAEMGHKIYPQDHGPMLLEKNDLQYDFIIVGAGSAGSVLANRLSENPEWNILLLEAGDAPTANSEIPYLYPILSQTENFWEYKTEPGDFCLSSFNKNKCRIQRGKALGGNTASSNLHYERGSQNDFKNWPSWGYDNITYHYKALENYQGSQLAASKFGTSGELVLNELNVNETISEAIFASAKEMDYNEIDCSEQLGFKTAVGVISNGERLNSAKAFLASIRHRDNLFVARQSEVIKVTTHLPEDIRSKGVVVNVRGVLIELEAKREVILCAGPINTAKILLLSGIGPQNDLKQLGIAKVVDLPVGKNFRDQIGLPIFVALKPEEPCGCINERSTEIDVVFNYLIHKTGYLNSTGLSALVGLINSRAEPFSYPDIKLYHEYFKKSDVRLPIYLENKGYNLSLINSIQTQNMERPLVIFTPTLLKVESRGQIKLKSNNPNSDVIINGNYLTDDDSSDISTLVYAYGFVNDLVGKSPLAEEFGGEILKVDLFDCRNYKQCSEKYVKCYIRSLATPMGQMVGTAKMGAEFDECGSSVVNPELLVRGIRHLRVVDASVIPEPISANVDSTVLMMGDKIAEEIKRTWTKTPINPGNCTSS